MEPSGTASAVESRRVLRHVLMRGCIVRAGAPSLSDDIN